MTRSIGKKTDKVVKRQDIAITVVEPDPRSYGESVRRQSKDKWLVAITEDLTALEANGVWAMVVPPVDLKYPTQQVGIQDENRCKRKRGAVQSKTRRVRQ